MSFDRKYFEAAEQEMSNRRNRNDKLLDMCEREIGLKYPEIYQISRELRKTSAKIMLLIADGLPKDEFEKKFAEIENENLMLQEKMRSGLVKKGYPADYLDTKYTCKICKDSGIADDRRCSCFMEIVKRLASEEMNLNTPMQLCNFSDFRLEYYDDSSIIAGFGATARDVMAQNLETCRNYAEDFHLPATCMGIFMRGGTGLGKTHLSLSIAKIVIAKGYSVIYGSAPDLLRMAEQEQFGKKTGNTLDRLCEVDLLVFDDLGAEFETKFTVSAVYNIINNRINSGKPTIVSTNLSYNEMQTKYGDRILSRLGMLEELVFAGTDVRVLKRNEKR